MPNVTISVPKELKDKMDSYTEINWSQICRDSIIGYINSREFKPIDIVKDCPECHFALGKNTMIYKLTKRDFLILRGEIQEDREITLECYLCGYTEKESLRNKI